MKWVTALREVFTHVKQTTFAYCPGCGLDLCSAPDVTFTDHPWDAVRYTCPCGVNSAWDFDAPVPLLLDYGRW